MRLLKSMVGGLAGAIALNLLHETVKRLDKDAPRVDLVGEEALNKGMKAFGQDPLAGNTLYTTTLAGDLISNTLYYSLLGAGNNKYLALRGIAHGAVAGFGALKLTEPMGLNDTPVNRTPKTQLLTVAYYALGGWVTALVIKRLS